MDGFTDSILLATAITSIQNGIEALEKIKSHKNECRIARLKCKGALGWLSDVKIELEDEE